MIINLVVDNQESWFMSYAQGLFEDLAKDHEIFFRNSPAEVTEGECAFFLSCERLVKRDVLNKNKHNIVVHASPLPQGKGWSPLTWQILEGKNEIPLTLFEAVDKVDSGVVYLRGSVHFEGHELVGELREKMGEKIVEMVKEFVAAYPSIKGGEQTGEETFYARRSPKDSELDAKKSLAEQFNLLRITDNERYPAFFNYRGHKYILKIYKAE